MVFKKPLYISIRVSDDKEITTLNKKFFDRNYPTDVLSFNMNEDMEDGTFYLGDIIVNSKQAEKQAKEYGNDWEHEIAELIAHGVLHLLGVHHPDDDTHVHGKKVD